MKTLIEAWWVAMLIAALSGTATYPDDLDPALRIHYSVSLIDMSELEDLCFGVRWDELAFS
jgi:hypothetical protein